MTDVDQPENWLEPGTSGQLSDAARRAATIDALPLVATYFAAGADSLQRNDLLARHATDALGGILEFVQIRVLLAAAVRLDPIIRGILTRPSFRYQRVREESVGVIRGRLDTSKYLQRRHERSAPRRFPVQNVHRTHELPENILACWACLNLAGHLKRLPLNLLPSNAPARRRAERAVESLRRLALHPALAQSTDAAEAVWRSDSHAGLVDRVRSRLRSGHVTNPSPYEALAAWVDGSDTARLIGELGDVDWMFYDESFDTKLFEIWSLHRLIQGLTVRLGEPQARRHLVDRSQGAVATWTVGGVTVEVWFQAGLGTVGRWWASMAVQPTARRRNRTHRSVWRHPRHHRSHRPTGTPPPARHPRPKAAPTTIRARSRDLQDHWLLREPTRRPRSARRHHLPRTGPPALLPHHERRRRRDHRSRS